MTLTASFEKGFKMTCYQNFVLTLILCKYLKRELDEKTNALIQMSAEEIALDDWLVYVIEIAYHIGYAKSILADHTSEFTYKRIKKSIQDNLVKRLSGG
jgi:hypothetical protein